MSRVKHTKRSRGPSSSLWLLALVFCVVGVPLLSIAPTVDAASRFSANFKAAPLADRRSRLQQRQNTLETYTPAFVQCPPAPIIRAITGASAISGPERDWVTGRSNVVAQAWGNWLNGLQIPNLDVNSLLQNPASLPRVALTFSGGGYRAMLAGAGYLNALDNRNSNSNNQKTGGVLQIATYLGGLSGGSWLLASWYNAEFPLFTSMGDVWNLDRDLFFPDGTSALDSVSTAGIYYNIHNDLKGKKASGFNVTLTDYWARLLSVHINRQTSLNDDRFTPTWSSFANMTAFENYSVPFPIVTMSQRTEAEQTVSVMANVWESSVFETGSYSYPVNAFINTQFLGTFVNNGQPSPLLRSDGTQGSPSGSPSCVYCFDSSSLIAGASSSLFNIFMQQKGRSTFLLPVATDLEQSGKDTALVPNPFFKLPSVNASVSDSYVVELVDGGEGGQNIPLFPFIQAARGVDFIVAFDSSADTEQNLPNGTSIVISSQYSRWFNIPDRFPPVPATPEMFVAQGLNSRTTLFGCGRLGPGANTSYQGPSILYVPNRIITGATNTSTLKLTYSPDEIQGFFNNGYSIATDTTGAPGATNTIPMAQCMACFSLMTTFRNNAQLAPPAFCLSCYSSYCWDGSSQGSTGDVGTPVTRNYNGTGPAPVVPFAQASSATTVAHTATLLIFATLLSTFLLL